MKPPLLLPLGAREIGCEWVFEEGGFGITAKTDEAGQPVIGVYPLSKDGLPSGHQTEYAYQRLLIRIVAGYDKGKAIVVFADVEITGIGMNLRVLVPPHLMESGLDRHLSAKWGSPPPRRYEPPANGNWAIEPTVRIVDA